MAAPGVFHIAPGDENLNVVIEMFTQLYREPVIVQRYLPEVRQGDKRIILIDGEAVGAINRVPPAGEARSNMHAGGKPQPSKLTTREKDICAAIGPALKERGLIFVGIDVIGDYMTEINVTSPTGLQEINRFDGVRLEERIWDAIEARLPDRRRYGPGPRRPAMALKPQFLLAGSARNPYIPGQSQSLGTKSGLKENKGGPNGPPFLLARYWCEMKGDVG